MSHSQEKGERDKGNRKPKVALALKYMPIRSCSQYAMLGERIKQTR